ISRFVRFLTYKAKLKGKRVIEIDESYTTKKCCCCGNEKEMPLYKRVYKCDCGNVIDRDENSAVNILLRYLSTNGLWTAYQQFIGNLRQTGLTIIVRHSQEAITSKSRF
ncbi:MAG: transposase, partial [Nanoarchaeota archaeon]|nr:transposase [Nanoarchaeota archaeon]